MTTISSSIGAPVTSQGVGSGLDIAGIVTKLMAIEQQPQDRLKAREAAYQTKLSAYGAARGTLAAFQTSIASLADPAAFTTFGTSIADDTLASVALDKTASDALSAGTHTLRVTQLAAAQKTASAAFASTASAVGTGTITIEFGTWNAASTAFTPNADVGTKTIAIAAGDGTLSGVRDAINRANAGVTASIVNDGSGNRLVLAGVATGSANGFRVATADADGNNVDASGLSALAYDPSAAGGTPQTRALAAAANALFQIDGLDISKPGNRVTDAIAGLAIDLKKAGTDPATNTTSFTIAQDTAATAKAIGGFVTGYNGVVANLASLTGFNATTKSAGPLNGDASLRLVATRLQNLVAGVVATGGKATTLADLGITFDHDGKLVLDSTKLDAVLAADPQSVTRLFAKTAVASDSLVAYRGASDATQVGAHALTVTQLASHGDVAGSAAAALTITAGVNDTLALTIDNVAATITIASGTYASADALATQLQSRVNGVAAYADAGVNVSVTQAGGVLTIASQRFGTASSVALNGGSGSTALFGASPAAHAGRDVAGTLAGTAFLGAGKLATGAAASAADGLKLEIAGGALGARGSVDFKRGLAAQIGDVLGQFLDADNGIVAVATAGIGKTITDIKKREDDWDVRLVGIRARLTAQYNAMDALVASMNSTSSFLTQQLTALQDQLKASRA